MLRTVESSELADWQAYDRLEPIGPQADREMLATLLAVSINANLDRKKHRPVSAADFMPGEDSMPQLTVEEKTSKMRSLITAMGAQWEAQQRSKSKVDA